MQLSGCWAFTCLWGLLHAATTVHSLTLAPCWLQTGKSSLAVQFVDGHFVESYYPTIENTFSKNIKYKGQEFSTEIIDTAGQVGTSSPAFLFASVRDAAEGTVKD